MARVYESKAEFRSALQHEKEGYTIYKNQVQQTTRVQRFWGYISLHYYLLVLMLMYYVHMRLKATSQHIRKNYFSHVI